MKRLLLTSGIIVAVVLLCGCFGARGSEPHQPLAAAAHDAMATNAALVWIIALSIFGIGACVAAAIFLPVKQLATAIAAGFTATLILALTVKAILPYLSFIALGLGAIAVAIAVVYFRRYVLATHAAIAFGKEVSDPTSGLTLEQIKIEHAAKQKTAGVKTIIDGILDKT